MNRKEKIIPCSSRVFVYNHKTKKNINMTVYDGVKKLLAENQKAQELFSSNKVDVTVKLNPNGSVVGVSLTPKNLVSSSNSSVTGICIKLDNFARETLSTTVRDEEKVNYNCADKSECLGKWWKDDSSSEEEEDLDLTLVLEEDIEVNYLEATQLPDAILATQLPPERISGVRKNVGPEHHVEAEVVEPDSTVTLEEEKDSKDSDDDEEPWMECWNCRAPKPIPGIYREDADYMRMIFCCDKPTRIKSTNTVIECNAKSYPYDSWVHHSFS